jgi:hypothetical protein
MLNPSTADEIDLDPTVTRCKKRAKALGYGGFEVANIFAYRSTYRGALYEVIDPIGNENTTSVLDAVRHCEIVICAWGADGKLKDQGPFFKELIHRSYPGKPHYLKLNSDGSPTHPLYLPYSLQPVLWGLD